METPIVGGLDERFRGELLRPGDPAWEEARHLWNGLIDKRPALIVRCADESDVQTAVRVAREQSLELAVRGGGHNVAGRAVVEGGLVIDLSRMRQVRIDPSRGTVRAQGGALLADVDDATLPRGQVTPLGLVGQTGLAGFTLHGGYGWLCRRYGLAVDNLVSARVVLGDGGVVTAKEDHNADLLWALRGGGGNFGVVTEFELQLHPLPASVSFGQLYYPLEWADDVMLLFRDFMRGAPDELTALATYWSAPDLPQIPESARGGPVVIVLLVHTGEPTEGRRALTTFREFGRPLADLSKECPFAEVQHFFDEDYPDGRYYYWKSAYLPDLPADLLSNTRLRTSERPSELSSIDVWGLGGAAERVAEDATAFAQRRFPFLYGIEANFTEKARAQENIAWAREAYEEAKKVGRGETYLNFAGFVEGGEEQIRSAYGNNFGRLQRIKAKYDPDNVFRGNFNILPGV